MKHTRLIILLLLSLAPLWHPCTAQQAQEIDFIENKGQWPQQVLFAGGLTGGNMLLTHSGFTYFYTSEQDMEQLSEKKEQGVSIDSALVKGHWYKVNFLGCNHNAISAGYDKKSRYLNYFYGNDSSKWKGKVGIYGKLKTAGIYNGIDLVVYSLGRSMKYDFVVHAGSQPGQIALQYEGVTPVLQADGSMRITTSVNEVIEAQPYAYQVVNGQQQAVNCRYKIVNNTVSFEFPDGYDEHKDLVIDPQLVFVTYSGAGPFSAGYFSFCSAYDKAGNFYAGGVPLRAIWFDPPLWPTTPGAFQQTYTSIYEPMVCINKYDAGGSNLLFSTYYGGSGPNDIPHAMITNDQGELIVAGSTGSFNLPVTPGCFDNTKSGGTDMFVAHFTADGAGLLGATYIGGQLSNSINAIDIYSTSGFTTQNKISPVEITLDSLGNIWAVTNTSTFDFPVTANACQPVFGGGNCDGVVVGLNPDCSQLLYGSYIGGSNTDVAYCIRLNHQGKVVVCGGTRSSNFPATNGAYMPGAPGTGDWDGYVAIIDPVSGNLLQATYLGTAQDDQCTHLQIDQQDNIYVLGRTFGNFAISPGVYALPGRDLFVAKMSPGLNSALLTTRLGNPQTASTSFFPATFLLDNCDHVYVGGLSQDYRRKLSNMPLTPDAFQTTPANFWFCAMEPGFSGLLYATYMGRAQDTVVSGGDTAVINGDHTHVGTYRLDPHGILYQSICANSLYYPGTPASAWSYYNQNSFAAAGDTAVIGQDIVSFKFRFDLSGTDAGSIEMDQNDTGCAPYTIQFSSYTYAAQTLTWDFGDGSPVSHDPSPVHTYTQAGTYQVFLAVHNDTVICHNDDTAYARVTIYNPQMPQIIVTDTLICDSVTQVALHVSVLNPSAFNQFSWQSANAGGIISTGGAHAIVNPSVDTLFRITVWDTIPGFCGHSVTDTIRIDYKPRKLRILTPDTLICEGGTLPVNASATAGYSYTWSPAAGVSDIHVRNPLITPAQTTTYTLTAAYPGCLDTARRITIGVDRKVGAGFALSRDRICMGESIAFIMTDADSTFRSYAWDVNGNGYLQHTGIVDTFSYAYDRPGTWPVTLHTEFRACPDTTYRDTVYVFAFPVVDLGPDTGLCLGGKPVYLRNLAADTLLLRSATWSTGDTGAVLKVVHPGDYALTVAAEPLGCSTTDKMRVLKDCYIDIPNVFTPNNDGVNDYFFPRQLLSRKVTRFTMQVFNRWGQVIFETARTDGRGWDGRFNGSEQPEGVYIYRIDVEIDGGYTEHYDGNVTLLR